MPVLTAARLLASNSQKHFSAVPQLIVHTEKTAHLWYDNKPVSLVLGFGGAERKHVGKYTSLYEDEGIPCVSYTGVNWRDNVPEASEGNVFAPLFEHPSYRDRNLIIHALSMNGFRSVAKLYRWMEHNKVNSDKITAVMFDSCPSVPDFNATLHGRKVTNPPNVLGECGYVPESIFKALSYSAMSTLNPKMLSSRRLFYHIMEAYKLPHEQHYVYSKADVVIDYKYIDQFIAAQIAKGCNVTSKRYEDVAHVRHINKDFDGYSKQVAELIRRSVGKEIGKYE